MPVKNAGLYLEECLDSIIDQSYANWELLAINDHSTDNSLEILERYAADNHRISVTTNFGNGIIQALRLAFSNSKGSYISRMDADDRMTPKKLELMSSLLDEKGVGHLIVGSVWYFSEGVLGNGYKRYAKWLNDLTKSNNNFREIYRECVIPSSCWMVFRTDLIKCGGFKPNRYPEDYDLCFRFYECKLKVEGITDILHDWRDYPTRSSRTDEHYADNRFLALKLYYFEKLELNTDQALVLWGAGKKGKTIARHLANRQINFNWVCNNDRKIGHQISGTFLQDSSIVSTLVCPQIIIAVANELDKQEIDFFLKQQGLSAGIHYWFFA